MKKEICLFVIALLHIVALSGCAKPDQITTLKSPNSEFFYTVETYDGHGPVSSDFTRVYAHLERNGKVDKNLVLDGEYLVVAKVVWLGPNEAILCVPQGFTNTFRNQITLHVDNSPSNTLRTHLQEDNCGPDDRSSMPK
jgi:hypothetical protein